MFRIKRFEYWLTNEASGWRQSVLLQKWDHWICYSRKIQIANINDGRNLTLRTTHLSNASRNQLNFCCYYYHYFYQVLFYRKGNVYSICGLQWQSIKHTCENYSSSFFPNWAIFAGNVAKHPEISTLLRFYECGIWRKRITTYYSHSTPLLGISEQSRKMLVNAVADSLWLFSVLENKWSESYLFMTQIFAWIKRIGKELWLKYADLNLKILQFHSDILEPARIRTNNAG